MVVQSSAELTAIDTAPLAAGNKNISISDKDSIRRYDPKKDMRKHLLIFKDAVTRFTNRRF